MTVQSLTTLSTPGSPARPARPAAPVPDRPQAGDSVQIDFQGQRPAHRVVKKLARGAACLAGAAGAAKVAFDLVTAPSLGLGLAKAALTLAATSGAIVGMDLASGFWHHYGDNYGPQPLDHVKWHTDTADTGYCLIGVSNGALDRLGFWPKWESLIHGVTGKEPESWKVAPYRSFATGQMDETTLRARQGEMGMPV